MGSIEWLKETRGAFTASVLMGFHLIVGRGSTHKTAAAQSCSNPPIDSTDPPDRGGLVKADRNERERKKKNESTARRSNGLMSEASKRWFALLMGAIIGSAIYLINNTHDPVTSDMNPLIHILFLLPSFLLLFLDNIQNGAACIPLGSLLQLCAFGAAANVLKIAVSLWGMSAMGLQGLVGTGRLEDIRALTSLVVVADLTAVLLCCGERKTLRLLLLAESLLNIVVCSVFYYVSASSALVEAEFIFSWNTAACIVEIFAAILASVLVCVVFGLLFDLVMRFTALHVDGLGSFIMGSIAIMSFVLSEVIRLSGFVLLLCCVLMIWRHQKVRLKSRTSVCSLLVLVGRVVESATLVYLGMSLVMDARGWSSGVPLQTLAFCVVFRSLGMLYMSLVAGGLGLARFGWSDRLSVLWSSVLSGVLVTLAVCFNTAIFAHQTLMVIATVTVLCSASCFVSTVIFVYPMLLQLVTQQPLVCGLKGGAEPKMKDNVSLKLTLRCLDHILIGIKNIAGLHQRQIKERASNETGSASAVRRVRKGYCRTILHGMDSMKHDARERNHNLDYDPVGSCSLANLFSLSPSKPDLRHSNLACGDIPVVRDSSVECLPEVDSLASLDLQMDVGLLAGLDLQADGGSLACLDLQALDCLVSRKMRDDSRVHHMSEDTVCRTRKKFVPHKHHGAEQELAPPLHNALHHSTLLHHSAPLHLRHLLSNHCGLALRRAASHESADWSPPHGGPTPLGAHATPGVLEQLHQRRHSHVALSARHGKNVSFADVVVIDGEQRDMDSTSLVAHEGDRSSQVSDDEGITFMVRANPFDLRACLEQDVVQPTAAESTLPWKSSEGWEPLSSGPSHHLQGDSEPLRDCAPPWLHAQPPWLADCPDELSEPHDNSALSHSALWQPPTDCENQANFRKLSCEEECSGEALVSCPDVGDVERSSGCRGNTSSDRSSATDEQASCAAVDGLPPPPWRTLTTPDALTCSAAAQEARTSLRKCNSVPVHESTTAVAQNSPPCIADFLLPPPWRTLSDERVLPDQHAPRPPPASRRSTPPSRQSGVTSSAVSYDSGSAQAGDRGPGACSAGAEEAGGCNERQGGGCSVPQASCRSFRLSEAESRHSEPVHLLHHVIDCCLGVAGGARGGGGGGGGAVTLEVDEEVLSLEQMDSRERVTAWLLTIPPAGREGGQRGLDEMDEEVVGSCEEY